MRPKLKLLAETLAARLAAESLCQLRGHLEACDQASDLVAERERRSGRARKGSRHLRQALAESAHGAVRTKGSQFAGCQRALTARTGYKRAILATAYKLLRTA